MLNATSAPASQCVLKLQSKTLQSDVNIGVCFSRVVICSLCCLRLEEDVDTVVIKPISAAVKCWGRSVSIEHI